MKKLIATALIILPVVWLAPADAQLFGRKPKAPPAQRIGELMAQVKSDPSESKRAAAAEELREFDVKNYPEVIPVLIDVARTDKSASVRHDAIESLSRIRPVSPAAGQVIEWAAAHDESWKVRWQAKSALTRYQWAGYRAPKNDAKDAQPPATQEPPLIDANSAPAKTPTPARTTPAKTVSQQPLVQRFANQPAAPAKGTPQPASKAPRQPVAKTPPPIIVDTPAPPSAPAGVPVIDLGPSVGPPVTAPVVTPRNEPSEPNFRPAGQTPPRQAPPAAPPVKNDDRGPALIPPM